jgi:hypothetical protein
MSHLLFIHKRFLLYVVENFIKFSTTYNKNRYLIPLGWGKL